MRGDITRVTAYRARIFACSILRRWSDGECWVLCCCGQGCARHLNCRAGVRHGVAGLARQPESACQHQRVLIARDYKGAAVAENK